MKPLKIPEDWRSQFQLIRKVASRRGGDIYIVGGFIRDLLLGKNKPLDIDVLILGEEKRRAFIKDLSLEAGKPQRIRKGEVYRFYSKGKVIDVVNAKGQNLEEDAKNRDFTVNALYLKIPEEKLIDPIGGFKDISEKKGRTCDKPEKTFTADPGRILRMFRIFEEQGLEPEGSVLETALSKKELLKNLSNERIGDEIEKIILSPAVFNLLIRLKDAGIIPLVFPGLASSINHDQKTPFHFEDTFKHSARVVSLLPPVLSLRFAGLYHDAGKPYAEKKKGERFIYSGHEKISMELLKKDSEQWAIEKNTRKTMLRLVSHHMVLYSSEWSDKAIRRFIKRTEGIREDLFELVKADISARADYEKEESLNLLEELKRRVRLELQKTPEEKLNSPLNGNEIMATLKIPPGPLVGKIKSELEKKVIDGELSPDNREEAIREVKRIYRTLLQEEV